jgi:hypothetical protein
MKKELKRGPWPPHTEAQKPVHVGLYEVRGPTSTRQMNRYWDGKCWNILYENGIISPAIIQFREWRGLAEKPE